MQAKVLWGSNVVEMTGDGTPVGSGNLQTSESANHYPPSASVRLKRRREKHYTFPVQSVGTAGTLASCKDSGFALRTSHLLARNR